jgi:hypothetical protein
MERSTIRTLLLVVGSAIGGIVIFVAAIAAYVVYKVSYEGFPEVLFPSRSRERREVVAAPPPLRAQFLGTQGSVSGDFPTDRHAVLAAGPGAIGGKVVASGKPVQGLRLRLALNGSVMSEWVVTDAAGRYTIPVPYGRYRVDGYELDHRVVNAVLPGKADSPSNYQYHSGQFIEISKGKDGQGPDFEYVDPVVKKGPQGEVSLSKPVVLEWEPYPGAVAYNVQIIEAREPRDYSSRQELFGWPSRPSVSGTTLDLSRQGVKLKKGYFYFFEITAIDAAGRSLADSAGKQMYPDFSTSD